MTVTPFIAGLAKVVAVGALMAGGAGGVYFVASTQSDEGEPQVVAETATPSGAETATAEVTPDAATPVELATTSTPTPTAVPPSEPMLIAGAV